MTTNPPTAPCAQCRKELPVTERVWFINHKVYCLICGGKLRNTNDD